jgi:hypothetical protein
MSNVQAHLTESAHAVEQAQEFYARLRVDLWNQAMLGHDPRCTWNDAVVRYVAEREAIVNLETSKTHLRRLDQHLSGRQLADVDRNRLTQLRRLSGWSRVSRRRAEGRRSWGATSVQIR